jgi:ribosome maturation factor RimP
LVARRAHNPKVVGSNPAPATTLDYNKNGLSAHFLFLFGAKTMQYRQDLHDIIEPAVKSVGYELFACEYLNNGLNSVFRVYIDKPDGITVDDCENASHQISAILDVDDPIKGQYNLEVSSPGIDRALLRKENFEQYIGQKMKLKLIVPIEKQRVFIGVLKVVTGSGIELEIGFENRVIPFDSISKANLIEDIKI